MRKLPGIELSTKTLSYLLKQTEKLCAFPPAERKDEADRLWKQARSTKSLKEVEKALEQVNQGLRRCMYCESDRSSAIEHWQAREIEPLRTFDWTNHLLSCSICNTYKRNLSIPIHPMEQDPFKYLDFDPETGRYTGGNEDGTVTIRVLNLSVIKEDPVDPDRYRDARYLEQGRQDVWLTISTLLQAIQETDAKGRLLRLPFRSILLRYVDNALSPEPLDLPPELIELCKQLPLREWLAKYMDVP
jgi:uncharacterized protein (TIGR02646 family)